MIDFCYDSLGEYNIGYPNLAKPGLGPAELDETYPRSIAFRPNMYFRQADISWRVHLVEDAPKGSWYPVALGWHDFGCDYFALMSPRVLGRVRDNQIRVLFYYHEGDNPERIQTRLDYLCAQHNLPLTYLFISANTAADRYPRTCYFPDHELFFKYVNRRQGFPTITDHERKYKFTALNRTHKWWRASVMTDLHRHGLLEQSLWSYNTTCGIDDQEEDNPISIRSDSGWYDDMKKFIAHGPYFCDGPDEDEHNDHRRVNTDLYTDSYCHLVIETLFDVDQSGGAFLTEKTYKCIKFGQPFVIIGSVNSLQSLRDAGYQVFDHAIDNIYDTIKDNTQRWLSIRETIRKIRSQDMHQWYLSCMDDLKHNQEIYQEKIQISLDRLICRLESQSN